MIFRCRVSWVWMLVSWLVLPRTTDSYSSGAPRSACQDSLTPRHGFPAQESPPPAVILLDQEEVRHRDYVRVTVRSNQAVQGSVTHTAHSSKRFVPSLQWKPSFTFSGNVTILATLVMDYRTYWTNVTSNVITVMSEEYEDIKVYG